MSSLTVVLRVLAVLALPWFASPETAIENFNVLYGKDLSRVAATKDVQDDIALADQMVEAAKVPKTDAAMIALLCDKAYELAGKDPRGFPTAVKAMEVAAAQMSARKEEYLANIIAIRQRQFDTATRADAKTLAAADLVAATLKAADARAEAGDLDAALALCRKVTRTAAIGGAEAKLRLKEKTDEFTARQQAAQQMKALASKLEANPADAALRNQLVQIYLVEMDNPAEAAKYLGEGVDAEMAKYVPAASQPVAETPELACLELGDWYMTLADKAPAAAKSMMLNRAIAYFTRFLKLHEPEDPSRSRVTLTLQKAQETVAHLVRSSQGPAPAGWIDLIKAVNPARDAVRKAWSIRDGTLYVDGSDLYADLYVPLAIHGSYRLQLTLVLDDAYAFYLSFPAGLTQCSWGFGGDNKEPGTLSVPTVSGNRKATDPDLGIRKGYTYNVEITVSGQGSQAEVTAAVEGRPPLRWQGQASELEVAKGKKPDLRIHMWAGWGRATITAFRLQPITGKVEAQLPQGGDPSKTP